MTDRRTASVTPLSGMEEFEAFYGGWIVQQQRFLDRLIRLSNQNDDVREREKVVEEVMSHYVWYYEEKAKAMAMAMARDELCFLHLSPPWLGSLEKAVLWMGGFEPCFALSLLEASVTDMLPEQRQRVEAVRAEVEEEENAVEEVVERVHEVIAAGRGTGGGGYNGDVVVTAEELNRAEEICNHTDLEQ